MTIRLGTTDPAKNLASQSRSIGEYRSELAQLLFERPKIFFSRCGQILGEYAAGNPVGAVAVDAVRLIVEAAARHANDTAQLGSECLSRFAVDADAAITVLSRTQYYAPPVIDVEISGALGSLAQREFPFENPHDSERMIVFIPAMFCCNGESMRASPMFDPPEFLLPACSTQIVKSSVALDPRSFRPRRNYRALVAIAGMDERLLRVHLTVTDPDALE